jgi:hypothetical protein
MKWKTQNENKYTKSYSGRETDDFSAAAEKQRRRGREPLVPVHITNRD